MADTNNSMNAWQHLQKISGAVTAFFRNKTISIIVRILLTAVFFAIVNKSISAGDVAKLAGGINPVYLAIAFLLAILGLYFQVARWKIVLKSVNLPCEKTIPLKTMLWGNFLGFMTPGRIGELFRNTSANPQRKGDSVLSVMIDRLIAIMMVLVSGCAGMMVQGLVYGEKLYILQSIALAVSGLAVLVVLFVRKSRNRAVKSALDKLPMVFQGLKNATDIRVILISVAAHACLLVQTAVLLSMFGLHDFVKNTVVAALAFTQMIFLPFAIANVGIREYSFGVYIRMLSPENDAAGIAFGVSGIILFFNIILPALGGLLWFMLDLRKKTQL
ncbi:MAG: lysylphosphatidylglycerol synthase transmembrane domain-containing protein [Fibrobacterota bacterium]|nr:lysylphosphatidylglycerol synthase transmembrane domain-containing protein [Chitinispirillaceae bacterium]